METAPLPRWFASFALAFRNSGTSSSGSSGSSLFLGFSRHRRASTSSSPAVYRSAACTLSSVASKFNLLAVCDACDDAITDAIVAPTVLAVSSGSLSNYPFPIEPESTPDRTEEISLGTKGSEKGPGLHTRPSAGWESRLSSSIDCWR
eukprot:scaffold2636_cov340-Pavlova_lutheri.AAC.50